MSLEPGAHLATKADAPAVIMADSGAVVTYAQLDEPVSYDLANVLR